ncbi:MAG: gluconokinase [Chloroflexi bacterium]|nr:gluconokinase [Chloroflexota bacterium]
MSNVLVLDIGSSSTRAMLFDERANLIPGVTARRPVEFSIGADGASEDDAEQAFERVVAVLDELQASTPPPHLVTAIGISAYACSLLCLDEHGRPLTPVYTYADTRSAAQARELRQQVDEMTVLQRTGCRIRANYLPSRIAWISRSMPDVFQRTRWFVSLSDYIVFRLFGRLRAGVSIWSWSGLLNRRWLDWDAGWLQTLGISSAQLPPLAQTGEWIAGLRPEYAARWPALKDAGCLPAVGDGAAANVGSGCVDDRHVAVTIGSTAAMRIVSRASDAHAPAGPLPLPPIPPALWCYRVDHARELIGGATTEGGNVFAWLRHTLHLPAPQVLEDAMCRMQPDAHHLTMLPLFAGERSPGYSDDSQATWHGLTLNTSPTEIARACLESIAYRLGIIYDNLRELAHPGATLIASGGALLASPTWCQIIADVTGVPLHVCEESEATSRGVALLVLEQLGVVSSAAALPAQLGRIYTPVAQRHAIYRAAMARQQQLYATLQGKPLQEKTDFGADAQRNAKKSGF